MRVRFTNKATGRYSRFHTEKTQFSATSAPLGGYYVFVPEFDETTGLHVTDQCVTFPNDWVEEVIDHMTLSELNVAIIEWAEDRQILKHSSAYAQAFKTAEEVMELVEAKYLMRYLMAYKVSDWDYQHDRVHEQLRDAIGDIYVTLVVGGKCYDAEYCDNSNLNENWSKTSASQVSNPVERLQKSLIPLGAASKGQVSYWMNWLLMVSYLAQVAEEAGTSLEACVNQAYDQIKDRKGHLNAQGIFVKEET